MIISEMIKQLEVIKEEYGDLPIFQHGHSVSMATLNEPKLQINELTEKMASRIIWNTEEELEIGEKFIWL